MYQVKTVYVSGQIKEFYVLNTQTKQVQSVWKYMVDALKTSRKLNGRLHGNKR